MISKASRKYVNVAVGLLHDESGARAEDWLHWRTDSGPLNASDGLKRNFLTQDLANRMTAWGK